ncbi:MAG: acyltransferase [Myxococcales bacterium]|nr:acyltransferase [Myxococcales bacterium]MCB9648986.1 acyltransferase [Deltaproteobacteria bacterium]
MRRWFRLGVGLLSFGYLIFVLNPIQMASLLVYPISPALARRANRWCARSIWGMWVLMAEVWLGIDVTLRGDPLPRRENALVLPNHQTMADVLLLICLAWRCGRLGDLKWFVKDIVKYVPGPGWGMWLLDCIFLKRDWMRDKQGILRLFAKYKEHQIPIFLVSFLEGTRRTPEKLADSQAYAKERGIEVPTHTLVPRTKGFVATMLGLRSHLDAVYDVTLGYPDYTPSLANCFAGEVKRVEIHVRRYPVAELPTDDEALSEWVFARFREKDRLMEAFEAAQAFEGPTWGEKPTVKEWLKSEAV